MVLTVSVAIAILLPSPPFQIGTMQLKAGSMNKIIFYSRQLWPKIVSVLGGAEQLPRAVCDIGASFVGQPQYPGAETLTNRNGPSLALSIFCDRQSRHAEKGLSRSACAILRHPFWI
jgi:hypothetical protein